jgi:hypothetical protein
MPNPLYSPIYAGFQAPGILQSARDGDLLPASIAIGAVLEEWSSRISSGLKDWPDPEKGTFKTGRADPDTHALVIGVGGYPYLSGGARERDQTIEAIGFLRQLTSPTPAMGDPSSRRHLAYIFDVPLTEMIRLGALAPGTEIRLRYPPGIAASISGEGRIRAGDRKFTSPSRAARALGSQSSDGWWDWVIGNTQETLAQRALPFRRGQVGLT